VLANQALQFIDGNVHIKPGLTRMDDLKKNLEHTERTTDKSSDKVIKIAKFEGGLID
jgi:hypothetical protein